MKALPLAILVTLVSSGAFSIAQSFYTVTDLGSLGGNFSGAVDINSMGQVIGGAATPSLFWHAFFYSDGVLTDIHPGGEQSSATSINSHGQVVGWSSDEASRSYFIYQDGKATAVQGFWPQAINDSGQIIGGAPDANGVGHAYLVTDGKATEVSPGGRGGVASAINNLGHVVGETFVPTSGFFFNGKESLTIAPLTPGNPTIPAAINDHDQIVGWARVDDLSQLTGFRFHAVLVEQGQVHDIGSFSSGGSLGLDINNNGQIVGFSELDNESGIHGFIYQNGNMFDLNSLLAANSGWVIERAVAINDAGQIVGNGIYDGVVERAFLMTPIPEPSTSVLALTAVLAWAAFCARNVRIGITRRRKTWTDDRGGAESR